MLIVAGSALAASSGPTASTNRSCYLVGQPVQFSGSGFAASRTFVVSIDGIYFGASKTNSSGKFATSLRPGGLGADQAQRVVHLDATDGTATAGAVFTVTRSTGARFIASSGNPHTLRAPFEIWGFGLDGMPQTVYLHYISPLARVRLTVMLGRTGGQCGYLRTSTRRVFPFSASLGNWTLQLDTRANYSSRPGGPVARIRVMIQAH